MYGAHDRGVPTPTAAALSPLKWIPPTGVIGGRRAPWGPVVEIVPSMKVAFKVKADESVNDGEEVEIPASQSFMKIGNFGSFCEFLDSMTAG